MFTLPATPGRGGRALGLLTLLAALFSGFALTTTPASAGAVGGSLKVHVITSLSPITPHVVVYVYDAAGVAVAKAEADAAGNAAFKLAAGSYKIYVKADHYAAASTSVGVVAGKEARVTIALQGSAGPAPGTSGAVQSVPNADAR